MAVSQEASEFLGHSNINTAKSIYAPYAEALNHGYIHAIEDQLGPLNPQQPATPTQGQGELNREWGHKSGTFTSDPTP